MLAFFILGLALVGVTNARPMEASSLTRDRSVFQTTELHWRLKKSFSVTEVDELIRWAESEDRQVRHLPLSPGDEKIIHWIRGTIGAFNDFIHRLKEARNSNNIYDMAKVRKSYAWAPAAWIQHELNSLLKAIQPQDELPITARVWVQNTSQTLFGMLAAFRSRRIAGQGKDVSPGDLTKAFATLQLDKTSSFLEVTRAYEQLVHAAWGKAIMSGDPSDEEKLKDMHASFDVLKRHFLQFI